MIKSCNNHRVVDNNIPVCLIQLQRYMHQLMLISSRIRCQTKKSQCVRHWRLCRLRFAYFNEAVSRIHATWDRLVERVAAHPQYAQKSKKKISQLKRIARHLRNSTGSNESRLLFAGTVCFNKIKSTMALKVETRSKKY